MAKDNDEFKYVKEEFEQDIEQKDNDNKEQNKSKKFTAPWNKKFGEDENFKTRQFSRSARNQPAKEATTLSQVLLFVLIIALVSPFLLYAVVNSQRDNAPIEERTAEQVRLSMNSEEEQNEEDESADQADDESASIEESIRERDQELAEAERESRRAESISSRELESEPETPQPTPETEPTPAPTPEPTPAPAPDPTPAPEPAPANNYYTVQAGDSWYGIASRHGVDVYTLAQMNGSSIDTPIYPGAQILVP